jgi:hypothetical protein
MSRRPQAYLDGFRAVRSVVELDELTAKVVLEAPHTERAGSRAHL